MITIHKSTKDHNATVRVTFAMPANDCCDGLYLVGWFNEWDESVYRMERTSDGNWTLTLELEPGCEYQYRFRTAAGTWVQDTTTPTPAQFGLNNSFVIGSENLV